MSLKKLLKGKKTYITAAVTAAVAAAPALGITVPPVALGLLTALGLIFARQGAATEVEKLLPY